MKVRLLTVFGHELFFGSTNLLGNHVGRSTAVENAQKVQEEVEHVFTILSWMLLFKVVSIKHVQYLQLSIL